MYGKGTNLHKALGIGNYAPIIVKPSEDGAGALAVAQHANAGVTICGQALTPAEVVEMVRAEQPAPQAEKLPDDFVNISCVNGRWYVDRVNLKGQKVEAVAMRHTYIAAKRFAASYAGKLGLPTHVGAYTLPALEPAPAPTEVEMNAQYRTMLAEQFNSRAEAQAALYQLFADEPLNNRGAYWTSEAVAEQFDAIMRYLEFSEVI